MRNLLIPDELQTLHDICQPCLGPSEILVSIEYSLYCNEYAFETTRETESYESISKLLATLARRNLLVTKLSKNDTFSHAGRVIAIGSHVVTVKPGDYIACYSTKLTDTLACATESTAIKLNTHQLLPIAALIGFTAQAIYSLFSIKRPFGRYIGIFGLDTFSFLLALCAENIGASVYIIDAHKNNLITAENFGFRTFDLNDKQTSASLYWITKAKKLDYAFINNKHLTHIQSIAELVKEHGNIFIPKQQKPIAIPINSPGTITILNNQQENLTEALSASKKFIKKHQALLQKAFPITVAKNQGTFGTIVSCTYKQEELPQNRKFNPSQKAHFTIGIAHYKEQSTSSWHQKFKNATIIDLATCNQTTDKQFDLVILERCTYHHLFNALKTNTPLFVHQPLITTPQEFALFKQHLADYTAPLCIDYHRSFSTCIKKTQDVVAHRSTPLIAHFRINSIKQTTHQHHNVLFSLAAPIFDLFYILVQAQPTSISVETLSKTNTLLFPNQNFCIVVHFNDGSLCSLECTNLGNPGIGTERLELFFDDKTIVMNDFVTLVGYGLPKAFDEKYLHPDTGHHTMTSEFYHAIKKGNAFMDKKRITTTTNLALIAHNLVSQGGGTLNTID